MLLLLPLVAGLPTIEQPEVTDLERRIALLETHVLLNDCGRLLAAEDRRRLRATQSGIWQILRFFWNEPAALTLKTANHMQHENGRLIDCQRALLKNAEYALPGSGTHHAVAWLDRAARDVAAMVPSPSPSPSPSFVLYETSTELLFMDSDWGEQPLVPAEPL
tara:strand:+ start:687 stop:1175 length:489 start_codon:yes stop_codon:yes gene_type:complete